MTIPEGEDRTQIAATIKDLGLSGDYLAASKSFKGFDPNQYGAQEPQVAGGIPVPGHLPARSWLERRPARLRAAPGLQAEHRRREHVLREVEEPDGLRRPHDRVDDRQGGADPLRASAGRRGDLQPPPPRHAAPASMRRPGSSSTTTRATSPSRSSSRRRPTTRGSTPASRRRRSGIPGWPRSRRRRSPAKVNYLYYVLNGNNSGHHCFTASGAEFNQLAAAYQRGHATPNCRS